MLLRVVRDLRQGLRTSIVNNGSAYGYSAAITLAYAATSNVLGSARGGELLLFAMGAGLGFAFVESAAVGRPARPVPTDPGDVVSLGGAFAVVSLTVTVAVTIGFTRLLDGRAGWLSWPAASFVATATYVVMSAVELATARAWQESRDETDETPPDDRAGT